MAEAKKCRAEIWDLVVHEGVALRVNRIKALNDLCNRIEQIIDERALDPDMQNIPGGKTGLLKRIVRTIGSGASALIVEEGKFDAPLFRLRLAVLDQARREMEEFDKPRSQAEI